MTEIRKEALRRLAYIGLAVLIGIPFINSNGKERWITLVAFLFVMFQFIRIVIKSQQLIDDLFPPKVTNETTATKGNKIIYNISMGLFFGGLVAMIFEATPIGNTIHGTKFFWTAASIGIAAFVLTIIFLKTKFASVFDESSRRYSVCFGYLFGFFLGVPAAARFLNDALAKPEIECKDFTVVRKSTGGARTTAYFIFCKLDGGEERFEVIKPFWDKVEENKTVELCLKKGYFGYDYVTEFKIPN